MQQNKPYDFSQYERSKHNVLDLVAQAVGWARKCNKPLACIRVKPLSYENLKRATEVLIKRPLHENEAILFDGVNIECGTWQQFDTIKLEYYVMTDIKAQA